MAVYGKGLSQLFCGQVVLLWPGWWQTPHVICLLDAGPLVGALPPCLFPFCPPNWGAESNPPPGPTGGTFSSAHWKKPHCCSLGLGHVWNERPLLGPSFITVRVTAGSLQLHTAASPPPPPENLLLPPGRPVTLELGPALPPNPDEGRAADRGGLENTPPPALP